MNNILFISWDGPQTTYMEGLFMPIFSTVQKQSNYVFHIVQFTWATPIKTATIQKKASDLGLIYTSKPIYRKPNSTLGSLLSVHGGIQFLKKYIQQNNIEIVMPRSTMPAIMINRIANKKFKLVFDADGFPLEERADFSGLSRKSKQYLFLKNEENKMLKRANGILTRSYESIKIHTQTIETIDSNKFSVITNGRNIDFFKPNNAARISLRNQLQIANSTKVIVYCGSLGPQYGWDEMVAIFSLYQNTNPDSMFLILTGNVEFTIDKIPTNLKKAILIKTVSFQEIPDYLSIADVAFAIREPKKSMKGIAPIKLGEYLLMGIPTIASAGIGDTEQILKEIPNCFIYDHHNLNRVSDALAFIQSQTEINPEEIREHAISFFSLEKSAEGYLFALNKLK